MIGCLFVARAWRPPPAGIDRLFAAAELTPADRLALLAGIPAGRRAGMVGGTGIEPVAPTMST